MKKPQEVFKKIKNFFLESKSSEDQSESAKSEEMIQEGGDVNPNPTDTSEI